MRGLAFEANYADFGEMTKRDELSGDVEAFSVGIVQSLSFDAGEHGRDGDLVDFISIGANWRF